METNPYAAPSAAIDATAPVDVAPALWNPNAAANWSLLFSPAFGAYLQMRNWQALGDEEKAQVSWYWFLATIGLMFAMVLVSVLLQETHPLQKFANRSGIFMLIAWYMASGRLQPAYVKERFGKDYPRKGWGKPIGIAIASVLAFFLAVVVLAVVAGAASA